MKKLLLICAAVMAFAVPAHAQLFMAWNACDGTAGSSTANMDFDCTPGSGFAADLYGTFGLPASTPGVVAIDGIIDLAFQGQTDVPAFWHLETGGCNSSGIGYTFARGTATTFCATTNSVLFCGSTGSGCGGGVTAYINGSQVPLGGPNRARLLFTNARPATSPVTLPGMPTRVFCFHITFITDNTPGSGGADCAGCETPTAFCWNQAVVFNNTVQAGGEGLAALIDSATPGSTGSIPNNGALISVTASKKSWGQLKSLYR
jgi:hypothetical protein